jgi:Ca2+-binding EF-hand superfamily protein
LNGTQQEEIFRVFTSFDTDANGLVDEGEFRRILETLGENPSDEVLSLEFAVIDGNDDGLVEFQEFLRWWLDYS